MEYLNQVLIYLKQELPESYWDISVVNEHIVFLIDEHKFFNDQYSKLYEDVLSSINRLRNKETSLKFTIKTNIQSRDFTI
ncbi:hypothetical protein [Mucilaginibacter sp. NFX135]|uniref:hypothetical protein n=1 Tax=Mucilaginibacter sp. NFX135 TaxID=3402687 RepID=UPI003AFB5E3E